MEGAICRHNQSFERSSQPGTDRWNIEILDLRGGAVDVDSQISFNLLIKSVEITEPFAKLDFGQSRGIARQVDQVVAWGQRHPPPVVWFYLRDRFRSGLV